LPQAVDAFRDFEEHHTNVNHTSTDCLMISVRTDQKPEQPKVT